MLFIPLTVFIPVAAQAQWWFGQQDKEIEVPHMCYTHLKTFLVSKFKTQNSFLDIRHSKGMGIRRPPST